MDNPRIVGHIISVHGLRLRVELLPETKSAYRATPDGIAAAVAINSYLTFALGAGETIVGVITDLEARERAMIPPPGKNSRSNSSKHDASRACSCWARFPKPVAYPLVRGSRFFPPLTLLPSNCSPWGSERLAGAA